MHDLVHDLASSVLSNNADGSTLVRYMFLKEESSYILEQEAKHLRTLFLVGETSGAIFSNFKNLRNLTLDGRCYTKLPDSVRDLIHLKNLNISSTAIRNLPEWIGKLHHLQTIRADGWGLQKLPITLKYLINLRHLYLGWETKLPAEIGKLTSLQTLRHFKVGEEKGYQIEELRSLKNLKGSLWIWNLERVHDKEEAMKANMWQKSNMSKLVFEWDEDSDANRNDESVLEGLQPHANLKVLGFVGYKGKTFPTWCKKMAVQDGPQGSWVQLDNLIKIALVNCSECEEISMLEHLPNLKYLYFDSLKKVRSINFTFKNLKSLKIYGLERLQCLPESLFCDGYGVSKLEIKQCPMLSELPGGLDTLNFLEELTISDCPNLKSIKNSSCGAKKYQGILRGLRIEGCEELMELPCQILELSEPTIKTLVLEGLRSLKNLPMLFDCLAKSSTRLKELTIKGVPNFMASGRVENWDLSRLWKLEIDVSVEWSKENSVGIRETVEGMLQGCGNSLKELELKGVENWEWVPQSIQHLTALSKLKLENIGVQEFPGWLGDLSSLWGLVIVGCKKLRCLPSVDVLKHLTKKYYLYIEDCPKLCIDPEWHNHPKLHIDDHRLWRS